MEDPIYERQQQAIEQVTGDAALTDNLTDEQAEQVLQWGTRAASWVAVQTAELDEEQAWAVLEPKLEAIRHIIRRLNSLMSILSDAEPDEVAEKLARLFQPIGDVPELTIEIPADLNELADRITGIPPGEAFAVLLSLLTGE
ncbi:MAG TPA: hypothetical protein PK801_11370 [Aggregatilineales bacterium]|nr:hypothetical protein [Chloroflexota bacterium]HOA23121.1 hypothetical protein [Aggregatilineales bacterium]HPV06922.1 hypothetical protein [Aggregatilineales bacterium]HQA68917.1 hypothetical protein [Aggregatilineales bacterium]HQE18342.1 hypothetical protein [Aggregatilineales bacterium]